eukprot:CAMPEP_0206198692 /NCGR_PEP_ID=MMETSP0166-20121206/9793_1 /ASSEMBLY_ACC=CAM_ASM_000260 /TAXON_ID=95228 /ORGANISM="Vannella robusta, Strain DIVA3 518/3/11/1/6" /LENGTH=158 /DNA_ID=CAMNT_0053616603 /DNA_START=1309 /DNA_END=1782 /DNA_ORIENTATION=-
MTFCTGEGCKQCKKGSKLAKQQKEQAKTVPPAEEKWTVEEGHFIMLIALTLSDTTQNHRIAPYAHASDGCIDLVFIKDISRAAFVSMFKSLKTGAFVDEKTFYEDDKLGYIKATKFRVDRLDGKPDDYVSVDGVQYEHTATLECAVIPSAVPWVHEHL